MKTADTEGFDLRGEEIAERILIFIIGAVCGIIMLSFSQSAGAASGNVIAASRFAACEQSARNYLAARYGWRIPNVEIEIRPTMQNPQHIAEFFNGRIMVLPSVEDCGVILHELVHFKQWQDAGNRDCGDDACYMHRESEAYAIERRWFAEQKD